MYLQKSRAKILVCSIGCLRWSAPYKNAYLSIFTVLILAALSLILASITSSSTSFIIVVPLLSCANISRETPTLRFLIGMKFPYSSYPSTRSNSANLPWCFISMPIFASGRVSLTLLMSYNFLMFHLIW